jgi:N-carbamoyl-L-amino-acid hydrolase
LLSDSDVAGPPANRFRELWDELAPIGRDPVSGGYLRFAYTPAELRLRDWFHRQADRRGMPVRDDGNGNLFAWCDPPEAGDAVLLGSHLDSVPHGGAYDGPLGVVSAFLAVDAAREAGHAFTRPVGVAAFVEEEGARFGVPCLGSRLLTGAIDARTAAGLVDADGTTLARAAGGAPAGARPELLAQLGVFVELHIEQGRALTAPVGLASGIWPHGRWRFDVDGRADHAGTTAMDDRRDPMLTFAFAVLAANKEARLRGAHATVGRVRVEPNATNAIPARVSGWLDARAGDQGTVEAVVAGIRDKVAQRAARDGTTVRWHAESVSPAVGFDRGLSELLGRALAGGVPVLPTAAGHDAGVLAAHLPTVMLFVRNPTGVSHSPAESATDDDCAAGVRALTDVLVGLACR